MADFTGTSGADELNGGVATDRLFGLGGNDTLRGGSSGNDTLEGGDGDDVLEVQRTSLNSGPTTVVLDGGSGNDEFVLLTNVAAAAITLTLLGGSGDDVVTVIGPVSGSINTGIGDDTVLLSGSGAMTLTLGAGADTLILLFDAPTASLGFVITDFDVAGGDVLDLGEGLVSELVGWDESNPFAGGFVRLLQSGAATLVQVDVDGSAGPQGWQTLTELANVTAANVTAANLTGFRPDGGATIGEVINGTPAGEDLLGSFGGDTITGGGGSDYIGAGAGADLVNVGSGDATVDGGAQDDTITGGNGADLLDGNAGNDSLSGGGGADVLQASGSGNETLLGGGGNDSFLIVRETGETGSILADGGDDDDTLRFTGVAAQVVLMGGAGNDTIQLFNATGSFVLTLGSGRDFVWLQPNAGLNLGSRTITITDFATGSSGDLLGFGTLLNATLTNYSAGANPFLTGHARLVQSGADTRVQIDADGGANSFVDFAVLQGVTASQLVADNLGFDPGAANSGTTVNGTAGNDVLDGTGGADQIYGLGGNDLIRGGDGSDSLYGGSGDDTYILEGQADIVFEDAGQGNDTVVAGAGYYLWGNIEALVLADINGDNDFFGVGNELANSITGNGGANLLIALDGNDTVSGGGGNDAIFGVAGNDRLNGDAGIDYLVGGDGGDTIDGGIDPDAIYGEAGNDSLVGGSSFSTDILVGGDGNDTIRGDSGLGDFDLMNGAAGDDVYHVDTPNDLTFEGAREGNDTVIADIIGAGYYLYPEVENLILIDETPFGVGNDLANRLTGNAIGNYLLGGAGNDTLDGGAGGDVLFGEGGADIFVFTRGTGGDVIGDFSPGSDRIDLSAFGFASFAALQTRFVENAGTSAINLDNGDLLVLNGVTNSQLTAADFLLG